ncbi:MAG: hypothetical protein ACKPKO_60035, partial [Candidatus Fonsibacter sp.]
MLEQYFAGRRVAMAEEATLSNGRIRGAVLAAHGSAPGIDGVPYEMYHYGASFVTAMLREALAAAGESIEQLQLVIGAAEDLLIWIPKPGVRP